MNAVASFRGGDVDIAVVLLGAGGVGGALLNLLATPAARGVHLVGLANSTRQVVNPRGLVAAQADGLLAVAKPMRDDSALLRALDASGASQRVIVDATAATTTAVRHAAWLRAGYHVVSANKGALGDSWPDWLELNRARATGTVHYGDAATVGAGLPVLATLRRLRSCGDRLLALDGVFSGTLSWLFNRFDGSRPFSSLLHEAHASGYTEPDPRVDLGGADVARKLLILARSAGYTLEADEVHIESLVPASLRDVTVGEFMARATELDDSLEQRRAEAARSGKVLRFLAQLDAKGCARVGPSAVEGSHPAARLTGTDNLFALKTLRYNVQPLVIQGPGAGREVTAQALLGDLVALRWQQAV